MTSGCGCVCGTPSREQLLGGLAVPAAGPAPSRNARAAVLLRSRPKRSPPSMIARNEGANAIAAASSAPPSPAAAQPTSATVWSPDRG